MSQSLVRPRRIVTVLLPVVALTACSAPALDPRWDEVPAPNPEHSTSRTFRPDDHKFQPERRDGGFSWLTMPWTPRTLEELVEQMQPLIPAIKAGSGDDSLDTEIFAEGDDTIVFQYTMTEDLGFEFDDEMIRLLKEVMDAEVDNLTADLVEGIHRAMREVDVEDPKVRITLRDAGGKEIYSRVVEDA